MVGTSEGEKYAEYCKTRNKGKSLIRNTNIEYEKSVVRHTKEKPRSSGNMQKRKR